MDKSTKLLLYVSAAVMPYCSLSVQPVALTEAKMEQNGNGEPDLPDIKLHVGGT